MVSVHRDIVEHLRKSTGGIILRQRILEVVLATLPGLPVILAQGRRGGLGLDIIDVKRLVGELAGAVQRWLDEKAAHGK